MKNDNYIRKRKLIAFFSRILFYICSVMPIKRNRIAICTFEGRGGFGCNPKYIVQKIHEMHPEYEFVWLVNDMKKEFPAYIRKVKNDLWNRAFWLSTSRAWIDNYRKPYGTRKRKGQYYVNTWHANIGFKSIGLWRGTAFSEMAYLVSRNDSAMIDDVVIDSLFCETMFRKGLVYDGSYLFVGQPRCDILTGDRSIYKEMFRKKNNLPLNARIVLFAPTFRESATNGKRKVFSEVCSLDFSRMLNNLEQRFGGSWYLCVRLHPQLADSVTEGRVIGLGDDVIDVSREDDMYEILAAMDVCVTDYSSVAFDASYCNMPVFIYADDIEDYLSDRGSLLWTLSSDSGKVVKNNRMMTPNIDTVLPFSISQNNDELESCILKFDEGMYRCAVEKMKNDVGLIFDGMASEKTANQIIKRMEK